MMGTDSSESLDLSKVDEVVAIAGTGESCPIIRKILLRDHAVVAAHCLVGLFSSKSSMGGQSCLVLHMDVSSGLVNEDRSTFVHVRVAACSSGCKQAAFA